MQSVSALSAPVASSVSRPDIDIVEDIALIIRNYPPLHVSHEFIQIEIHGGHVTLRGNVRSLPGVRYLQNEIPRITGVTGLNLDHLYDDEAVRLNAAEKLPEGLYVNVQYGVVALYGAPAAALDQQALFTTIKAIPGVRHVLAQFSAATIAVKS